MAKPESQRVNSHCLVCGTRESGRTNVLKRRVSADRPGNWKDPVRLGSTQCVYGEGEGRKTCSKAPCWHIVCQSGISLVAFARAAEVTGRCSVEKVFRASHASQRGQRPAATIARPSLYKRSLLKLSAAQG